MENNKIIVVLFLLLMLFVQISCAEDNKNDFNLSGIDKNVQKWQVKPEIPNGWIEIDRLKAKITNNQNDDVFSIITDGQNDLIIWFEKTEELWKMVILYSVPTKKHTEYGVNTRDLRLFLKNKNILYGIEGSEAISIFKWDSQKRTFFEYIPSF